MQERERPGPGCGRKTLVSAGAWCAALGAAALIAACGGGATDHATTASEGWRSARGRPSTCAYEHVFVTIEKVVINRGAAAIEIVLPQPRRIDLLALEHGLLQALGTPPLAPGHYQGLRLVLSTDDADAGAAPANAIQPVGAAPVALRTPGAEHGGLKVRIDFDVPAGRAADLALDPDQCQLVGKPRGNAGEYVLNPVVAGVALDVTMASKGEFRVSMGNDPDVSALADGGYLVAWAAGTGDWSTRSEVHAQRYLPDGSPAGSPVRVNSTVPGTQNNPRVATLADGGWVIAWGGSDTPRGGSIAFQQYARDGAPVGGERRPDMPPTLWQHGGQTVLGLADGSYVLAWDSAQGLHDFDVWSQRYAPDGIALGPPARVNVATDGVQGSAALGRTGGGHVIAWTSQGQDGSGLGVYARRYAPDGSVSDEMRVNTRTSGDQTWPAIATLANGDFVIIWVSDGPNGPQTTISSRRYTAAGIPVGPEQVLVDSAGTLYWYRAIASLADGGHVLAWGSCAQYGSDCHVDAQRYDAAGAPAGERIRVDSLADARDPAVAGLSGGGFVIVWSFGPAGLPYVTDVYGQQFDALGARR